MDRNQGVIHLGKNKSPQHFKRVISYNNQRISEPSAISRQKNHRQQSFQGQKIQASIDSHYQKDKIVNFANTHNGFTTLHQKQNTFENRQIISSINNQAQLIAKIRLLQARVQQLHHQKQTFIMNAHEQNKRILYQNNHLKHKLTQIERIKNNYMVYMRQQISKMGGAMTPTFGKQNEVQKQQPIFEQQDNISNISIDHHMKNDSQLLELQNKKLKQKLSQMQQKLKGYININQKNKIIQNNLISQENKLSNYQSQQNKRLKMELENSRKQVQFYVQRLLKKSQQLMWVEQGYKEKLQKMKKEKTLTQQALIQLQTKTNGDEQKVQPQFSMSNSKMNTYLDVCPQYQSLIKQIVKLSQKPYTNPGTI